MQQQLITSRTLLFVSLYICFISGIYIKSSISQKENHLSLRKSVKWRFTLKFVFRQIQESRLLVRVYVFMCVRVCMRSKRTALSILEIYVQKGISYRRSHLVHCNVLCKVIVGVRTLIVIVMRLEWLQNHITLPWNVWFTNAHRDKYIKQMLITSRMHRVKQSNYFHICSAHIEADIINYNSFLFHIYVTYLFFLFLHATQETESFGNVGERGIRFSFVLFSKIYPRMSFP